jgi:protein phosphatase
MARCFAETSVGRVREHNEDNYYADPDGQFFCLADGMGGHAAGEVASLMATEVIRQVLGEGRDKLNDFTRTRDDDSRKTLVSLLEQAVRRAHQEILERGTREPDKEGMGTTLDVLLLAGGEAFVAHVGDSRTYLVRGGQVARITTDHTVAEILVLEGRLSADEARESPLKTILLNAVGVAGEMGVEVSSLRVSEGDRFLLCSDGLHDYFPDDAELGRLIAGGAPPEALREAVQAAYDRGGQDNITGLLVEIDADDATPQLKAVVPVDVPEGIWTDEPTAPVDLNKLLAEKKGKRDAKDHPKDHKDQAEHPPEPGAPDLGDEDTAERIRVDEKE